MSNQAIQSPGICPTDKHLIANSLSEPNSTSDSETEYGSKTVGRETASHEEYTRKLRRVGQNVFEKTKTAGIPIHKNDLTESLCNQCERCRGYCVNTGCSSWWGVLLMRTAFFKAFGSESPSEHEIRDGINRMCDQLKDLEPIAEMLKSLCDLRYLSIDVIRETVAIRNEWLDKIVFGTLSEAQRFVQLHPRYVHPTARRTSSVHT